MPDITHTEHAVTHARAGDALNLFAYDDTIHIDTRSETDGEIVLEGQCIHREIRYRLRATPEGTRLLAETRDAEDSDSEYTRKGYTRANIDGLDF